MLRHSEAGQGFARVLRLCKQGYDRPHLSEAKASAGAAVGHGAHPVLRALELAAGPALEHVAQVDDDGARDGRDVDPDAVLQDLQAGGPVRDYEQTEADVSAHNSSGDRTASRSRGVTSDNRAEEAEIGCARREQLGAKQKPAPSSVSTP